MRLFGQKEREISTIAEDKAWEMAQQVIAAGAIKPEEFIDEPGYTEEEIKRDQKYVERIEKKIADEQTPEQAESAKKAEVFEALLYDQTEKQNWLGQDTSTIKTSRFDDIANGVDMAVEVLPEDKPASHIGLAVDATFSNDVDAKIKAILKSIDEGTMAHIKYFHSENTDDRKKLYKIPRVVIGAGADTVDSLAELWLRASSKKADASVVKESKETLRAHFIQFQILEQILMQLHAFEAYARRKGRDESAAIYHEAYEVFDEILQKKRKDKEVADSGRRDSVHYTLMTAIENIR